jgi:hypothetical protein
MMRIRTVITVAVFLLISLPAIGGVTLAERSLLGDRLTLLVPESFTRMGDEMLRRKYPSERRPTLVLTNREGSVNVAVNHTQDALQPSQIAEAHASLEQTFRRVYPSARWERSEVVSLGGRDFFVLDLRTPSMDTEVRNIMAGTSLDGRLLLIAFNCTREMETEWGAVGQRIVESARLAE